MITLSTPALAWRSWHVPKAGNAPEEYEDASAGDASAGRFAIADGASESSFAAAWARLLVEGHVQHAGPWAEWFPQARADWNRLHENLDLPWFAQAKLEEGAFATLLGLTLERGDAGVHRFAAHAIGDSCLFQIRAQRLVLAFPLEHAGDFGNQPRLLGSRASGANGERLDEDRRQGIWHHGDQFFLMTDALAQWFLRRAEQGLQPWRIFSNLNSDGAFAEFIAKLRNRGNIRNDDVTLVRIQSSMDG